MNENILLVLNKLKERWEITPKKPRVVNNDVYSQRYEPLVAHILHITWINDLPLDYTEFESILGVLVEKEVITRYRFIDDILEIKYAEDFLKKYSEIIGKENYLPENPQKNPRKLRENQISYFPDSGDAGYKESSAIFKFGTKGRALLDFLYPQKNSGFNIREITQFCNPNILKEQHRFREEKDIKDTIRDIRIKLGVKTGEYFPIHDREMRGEKQWIWAEK